MSLLGHLVPEWRRESAATRALAYILDPHHSEGMAQALADLLCRCGVPAFAAGRVEHDPSQKDDSRPDLTLHDTGGTRRVFVETTFWDDVHKGQPAAYLKKLPANKPAALVFVAPRDRTRGLWRELKTRCEDSRELDVGPESRTDDAVWARVGARVLVVTSWTSVLDTLQRAAADVAVEQDVLQLQGLTYRIDREAFLPLKGDEVHDAALAGRIEGYQRLVDKISERLEQEGLARKRRYSPGSYRTGRGTGQRMQVHGKLDLRFGVELQAWRDSKITPLWWVLKGSDTYSIERDWLRIRRRLKDVRSYDDSLYIPVRLKTGVAESYVIADAVKQIGRIAADLRQVCGAKAK